MREAEVRNMVDEFLEGEATHIAAFVEMYGMEDDLVRRIMDHLSMMREKMIKHLAAQEGEAMTAGPTSPFQPHPEIGRFLHSINRGHLMERH